MTAKEIWAILRFCNHCRITTRVYKDWIRSDENCVGFVAHVNSNLGKSVKIEKIREYCKKANLPVIIENEMQHLTRIKIVISK